MTALTPADRDALVARAKSLAVPVTSCVAARIPPAHLIGDMTRDELAALVIVLAEAVDPVRLRTTVRAVDDGAPGLTDLDLKCRAAHTEAGRLRSRRLPVPPAVSRLDGIYRSRLKATRKADAA